MAEGSVDGLFEAIDHIEAKKPARLIHGHTPLTANFTVDYTISYPKDARLQMR